MIAISYRREDSLPIAGRLYDHLEAKFGKRNVFMDFDSIRPGLDFRQQIKETIERSDVVIALIGPNWVGQETDGSRRIDEPTDFVRLEIDYALKRGIPVIPVLINNTVMPKPGKLPTDIQEVAFRHALPLDSGLDFRQHVDRLIDGIQQLMPVSEPAVTKKTATTTRYRELVHTRQGKDWRPIRLSLRRKILVGLIAATVTIGVIFATVPPLRKFVVEWYYGYIYELKAAGAAREKRAAEEAEGRRKAQEQKEAERRAEELAEQNRQAEEKRKAEEAQATRKAQEEADAKRRAEEAAEATRKAEEKRKAEEAQARRKQQEEGEATRRADEIAEANRKAEEKRRAEEARLAALPKTITVPADEATISTAMMRAKKGDTIKVKAGTYDDQIIYTEGVALVGESSKAVTVHCEATKAVLRVENCKTGKISGITFEHDGNASDPSTSWVMYIANSNIEVFDCRIRKGSGFGIVIEKGASPSVHDCVIEENTWSGIIVNDTGTKPKLKSNQCRENGQNGVFFARGSGGTMERNQCEGNQNGICVANEATSPQLRSNQCRRNRSNGIFFSAGSTGLAEDNHCESNLIGIGVGGAGTKPVLLANQCRKNETGILFDTGANGTAENNKCEGNAGGIGVKGAGTSVTLTRNHCLGGQPMNGHGGFGITVQEGATASVIGNTCENNAESGIFVGDQASSTLQGNICRTNQFGIVFRLGATGAVIGNRCERNTVHGIGVGDQGTSPEIGGNTVFANGGNGIFVGVGATPKIGQNSINGNTNASIYYENPYPQPIQGDY